MKIEKMVAAAAAQGLVKFIYADDGTSFGIGTVAELDALKAQGYAPADATTRPVTADDF